MSIKEKVYEKLWELFPEKCLEFLSKYIQEKTKYNPNILIQDIRLFKYFIDNNTGNHQLFTILFEILPIVIIIEGYVYKKTLYFDIDFNGKQDRCIWYKRYDGESITIRNLWNADLWQAILSLLEAIESHPERPNFKYVWRRAK